jgi:hypothetical protein
VHPLFPRELTIACNATKLTISAEGLEPPQCRKCQTALNIHQPDEDRPEHLLGTCAHCGEWYLIEYGPGLTEAFLFDLPNATLLRATIATAKSPSRSRRKRSTKNASDADQG